MHMAMNIDINSVRQMTIPNLSKFLAPTFSSLMDSHDDDLSPTGGMLEFKNFSTSSISSGVAECSRPLNIISIERLSTGLDTHGYIFKSTLHPSSFSIVAVEAPHSGLTRGSESP